MTKTQVRKAVRELTEKLGDLRATLDDLLCEASSLQDEVQDTIDNIEPYEGYNDLTPEQEERQEWLENVVSALEELANVGTDDLSYAIDSAEEAVEE